MNDQIDFLDDINERYSTLEYELEQKLKQLQQDEQKIDNEYSEYESNNSKNEPCSMESAKQRNIDLIKALEISKARLRSRATYSPLETILDKAITNYRREMSLTPIYKKNYGPTFV